MSDTGLTIALVITIAGCLAGLFLALELARARLALAASQRLTDWYKRHLGETQAALQTALGGGWQLADPASDVYLLPESAILDFSDTTTGGQREQFSRSADVTLIMDSDLLRRIQTCYLGQLPISFRGLEWKSVRCQQERAETQFEALSENVFRTTLSLVTYAARPKQG